MISPQGGGAYLLVIEIIRPAVIRVGALGEIAFPAGWYVYAGSAMRGLEQRIRRHLSRRKKLRWHIDYITVSALRQAVPTAPIRAVPFPSSRRVECDLARAVLGLADGRIAGFGCSDCACSSHLFAFQRDPLLDAALWDGLRRRFTETADPTIVLP